MSVPYLDTKRQSAILRKDRERRDARWFVAGLVAVVFVGTLWFSAQGTNAHIGDALRALGQIGREAWPPDFGRAPEWGRPLLESLSMSIAGTILATIIAVPLAVMAARVTAPFLWLSAVVRLVFNLSRALPELILGVVLVAAVGFGTMSGVLALALHSVGMLGKFFAETIDHSDPSAPEALKANGASPLQVQLHGVLPLVWGQWRDILFYRWEYNFRASTILGMVGAGGLGAELIGALRILDYQQTSALLITILVGVTLVDWISARLRVGVSERHGGLNPDLRF
ncbi:phosphonate ABC transporter, permease protein PhnE [uncultured Tateyamaria sp.]|uniref:phosphonate ABC transporter, permease protein PhnE n=1 Tax=uncultured Tateyamaria sp. TaxID=455651 RepID=UPI0026038F09|nr:phosphonate ABC transporter, permease protein PhnE [uncultured Tateyamaria sp.]